MPWLKKIILVVDDEELVRVVVAECLEGFGYSVLQADCGPRALAMLHQRCAVELLLTDIRMPQMSGIELAKVAIELCPDLKIVLMTGYFVAQERVNHRILYKPFLIKELQAAIVAELQ